MKFELKKKEYSYYDFPPFLVTISRTEFLKNYENDKPKMLEELDYLVEMFCSPNCFCRTISEIAIDNIAKNFAPKYSAFFLEITENEEGLADLQMGYIKKVKT